MADQSQLNSLDRFRKRPGSLVLEEHGHCEVPAGCGGVVLRWRDPRATTPLIVSLYTPVEAHCYLDETELRTAGIDLRPGKHVVAIAIEPVDCSAGLIMFAATHDPAKIHGLSRPDLTERPVKVLTADDGTWKFSLALPASDDWTRIDFDDKSWPSLTRRPTPQVEWGAFGAFQNHRCRDEGAACLGLPQASPAEGQASWWARWIGGKARAENPSFTGRVWVRKVFEIEVLSPDRP